MTTEKKQQTQDTPGVFFTGETKSGFAKWTVQGNYNGPVNQNVLEDFTNWKLFANTPQALSLLLKLYFEDLASSPEKNSDSENDELALFFIFMSKMVANDFKRLENQIDDLIEDE